MTWHEEVIGGCRLILGDCREVLPTLRGIDAVVTDPPYGNGFNVNTNRNSRRGGLEFGRHDKNRQPTWKPIPGNERAPDVGPLLLFPQVILWGGNSYPGLPAASRWLVWDKRRDSTPDDHGDAELAWTNLGGVIRIHRQVWRGIVREGEENVANGPKVHPFQKPVSLMEWCIRMTSGTVADPYMGSGTTGVACARIGRRFVGIECVAKYFDTACGRVEAEFVRVEAAQRQGDMLCDVLAPAKQEASE